MSPLERLRIEKAASDCGFEMTPLERHGGLELRSIQFPEAVVVRSLGELVFEVVAPPALQLNAVDASLSVNAHGYEELYQLLRAASSRGRTLPNRIADAFRQATADMPRTTEAERVVVARVGQTMFRAALMDYWQERCCVTGLDVPELLRASHIKPWASCERDEERLDVFNGLLLAPQVDALFDGGWISFADAGNVLVSSELPPEAINRLGLSPTWRVTGLSRLHKEYLAYHRLHVLRKRGK